MRRCPTAADRRAHTRSSSLSNASPATDRRAKPVRGSRQESSECGPSTHRAAWCYSGSAPPGAAREPARQDEAPPTAAQAAGHGDDEKAIAALVAAFTKAFNAGDAAAAAATYTEEALVVDEQGERTEGRAAIRDQFAASFADSPGSTIAIQVDSLRFLGPETALEEGRTTITPAGAGGAPEITRFTVVYVKHDGHWLQSAVRDEPAHDLTPHDRLKELEWLVGDWVNESQDAVVTPPASGPTTATSWSASSRMKTRGQPVLSGTQRIGWDPLKRQFKTWIFDSEGGHGEGYWTRNGDQWVIKVEGVRQDGQPASATNIITRLGKDRASWQSVDRTLGGAAVPGIDEFVAGPQAPRGRQVTTRSDVDPSISFHRGSCSMTRTLLKLALGTRCVLLALPSDVFAGRGGGGGGGGAAAAAAAVATAVAACSGGGWRRRRWRQRGGYGGGGWRPEAVGDGRHSPSFSQPRSARPMGATAAAHLPTRATRQPVVPANQRGHGRAARTTPTEPEALQRRAPPPARATPTATSDLPTPAPPPPARATPTATSARQRRRRRRRRGLRQSQPASPSQRGRRRRRRGLCQPQPAPNYSNAGAAAAGRGYANRNQYDPIRHAPVWHGGYWNGNNYAGWRTASGYGGSGPGAPARRCTARATRATAIPTRRGCGQAAVRRPGRQQPASAAAGRVAGLRLLPADQHDRRAARADRRRPGDLGLRPGPRRVQGGRLRQGPPARPAGARADAQRRHHARVPRPGLFAQGKYEQAAAPLYAVLSVGPGWDWTTLSGMYPDVDTYTGQLRSPGSLRQGEPRLGPGPLRAGLPVPVPGARRERRRPAQGRS